MSRKHGWTLVWILSAVVVALLVAACGPEMATSTPRVVDDTESPPTAAPAGETEDVKPPDSGELPVDADDWRVLGSPDAPITIVEYSDFQ